jgi:hypothetical protein
MRILITHLTRMAPGYCCVAGITEREHEHVRPVLGGRRLGTALLAPAGPFDFGAIVELGRTHAAGQTPPEVEDRLFDPRRVERLGYVGADRLWKLLESSAGDSVYELFGPDLEHHGERASVAVLHGSASLGLYRPIAGCQLLERESGDRKSLRVRLPAEGMDLSLTDARYYTNGYQEPARERVVAAQHALTETDGVLLGLGLTRPFASDESLAERHWLQVTALHVRSDPALRLAP